MSALLKNQSIKFSSDAVMKLMGGGGKKAVVFPPKRSKDLSTGCGVRRAGSSQKKIQLQEDPEVRFWGVKTRPSRFNMDRSGQNKLFLFQSLTSASNTLGLRRNLSTGYM